MPGGRQRRDVERALAQARERIAALEDQLAECARSDAVTGLVTLDCLRAALDAELGRAQRHGQPLSVVALDVDGFAAINREHGWDAGDAVLAAVGSVLRAHTRAYDVAARSGGDGFLLLLPATSRAEAHACCERILLELEATSTAARACISVSIGIADTWTGAHATELLAAAEAALEVARAGGGGRIVHVDEPAAEDAGPVMGHNDAVAGLAVALLERDRYTGEHSESVVELAASVATALGCSAREIDEIRAAALVHDIGKVAIPDGVLHKPGPLDETEWELMREHPVIGERILRAIPGLGGIARIVRHEHERFDGAGYPDGLAGHDVPLGSRIILACDAYHAMTSDRPYRSAMSHEEALGELHRCAGTQFDPAVVAQLVGVLYGGRHAVAAA